MKSFEKACHYLSFKSLEELNAKRAKMFPVNKCKLTDEINTTSLLLACLVGIKEFREGFFQSIGFNTISNKSAKLHAFTEIITDEDKDRPDGLIFIATGKAQNVDESFFLEVKTKSELKKDQVEKYLEKCKQCKVDNLITISNDFVTTPEITPVEGIKNRKNLFHFSWKHIATILQNAIDTGIEDEDQIYLAKELLDFLDNHPDISHYNRMSKTWNEDLRALIDNNLKAKEFNEISSRVASDWIQEENDICLQLRKNYNKKVDIQLNSEEKKSPQKRLDTKKTEIKLENKLSAIYCLSEKMNEKYFTTNREKCFTIELNLATRKFKSSIEMPVIKDKKVNGQLNDLIRLLDKIGIGEEDRTVLEPVFKGNKSFSSKTFKDIKNLKDLSKNPNEIFELPSLDVELKHCLITMEVELNNKELYSPTKVIEKMEDVVDIFFKNLIEPMIV